MSVGGEVIQKGLSDVIDRLHWIRSLTSHPRDASRDKNLKTHASRHGPFSRKVVAVHPETVQTGPPTEGLIARSEKRGLLIEKSKCGPCNQNNLRRLEIYVSSIQS